jgi:hypothetical protein
MNIISEKYNPLDRIKIVTVIKITDFDWYAHSKCDYPYIQISIDGLVLDGTGEVADANIQDAVGCEDYDRLNELMAIYKPGSLHWLEGHTFWLTEGKLIFLQRPNTCPAAIEEIEDINRSFSQMSTSDHETHDEAEPTIMNDLNVSRDMDNCTVTMSGRLERLRITHTKIGRKMATARLCDRDTHIDLIIFPDVYRDYEKFLLSEDKISITGMINVSESSSYLIPQKFEFSGR